MNISKKTVLITGGGSGIGFETAKLLSEKGNKVIITGRNAEKLQKAAASLNNVIAIPSDVSDPNAVKQLVLQVKEQFPELSVLINNAGNIRYYQVGDDENDFENAAEEIDVNYLSLIRLTALLLPVLKQQSEAAVVNVSSIVAIAPSIKMPTYSASKAAVHSYTKILRYSLAQNTNVKVFELMPPLVATEFSIPVGGTENGIPPLQVAEELVTGLEQDIYEIRSGKTAEFYKLFLSSPETALAGMNA